MQRKLTKRSTTCLQQANETLLTIRSGEKSALPPAALQVLRSSGPGTKAPRRSHRRGRAAQGQSLCTTGVSLNLQQDAGWPRSHSLTLLTRTEEEEEDSRTQAPRHLHEELVTTVAALLGQVRTRGRPQCSRTLGHVGQAGPVSTAISGPLLPPQLLWRTRHEQLRAPRENCWPLPPWPGRARQALGRQCHCCGLWKLLEGRLSLAGTLRSRLLSHND